MALTIRAILRGSPISATHQPSARDLQLWLEALEQRLTLTADLRFEDTRADLLAVSAPEGATGFVSLDPTPAQNGVYRRTGSSWTRTADLPPGFSAALQAEVEAATLGLAAESAARAAADTGLAAEIALRAPLAALAVETAAREAALADLGAQVAGTATAAALAAEVADRVVADSDLSTRLDSLAGAPLLDEGLVLVADAAGRPVLAAQADGLDFVPSARLRDRIGDRPVEAPLAAPGAVILADAAGAAVLTATPTGLNFSPSDALLQAIGAGPSHAPDALFVRDRAGRTEIGRLLDSGLVDTFLRAAGQELVGSAVDLVTVQGQSLSVGSVFSAPAAAPDLAQTTDGFILTGLLDGNGSPLSIRGWLSLGHAAHPAAATGLAPARYGNTAANPIPAVASGVAGFLNAERRRTLAPRRAVVTISHGYAGVGWSEIDDDPATGSGETVVWDNLVHWYGQAKAFLQDGLGLPVRVPWHVLVHGTSARDEVSPGYYDFLHRYLGDFRAAVAGLGLAGTPRLVLTQSAANTNIQPSHRWDVIADQLRFCAEGHAVLAAPLYHYPIADNVVHPDGETTLLFSEAICRAIAEEEAGRRWTALAPSLRLEGSRIHLRFDTRPDEVLQLHDPARYGGAGIDAHLGFELEGGTIAGVAITAPDTVTLTVTGTPTALRYAFQTQDVSGLPGNRWTGHRGLLRTSYAWPARTSGETLWRWVPSFRLAL